MGAHIILRPKKGKFETQAIVAELKKNKVIEAKDKPLSFWVINSDKHASLVYHRTDTADVNHPAHRGAIVEISSDEVLCGINWSDGTGAVRRLILWILDHYDCDGEDGDGHDYTTKADFWPWLDLWLPEQTSS